MYHCFRYRKPLEGTDKSFGKLSPPRKLTGKVVSWFSDLYDSGPYDAVMDIYERLRRSL